MEKINIEYRDIESSEVLALIKGNKNLIKVINEFNISDNEIIANMEFFLTYINHNKRCEGCKSMNDCKQTNIGHIYGIKRNEFDGSLTDYYTICPLFTKYYERKENLVFTTFDERKLLDGSQSLFLYDNINKLGPQFVNKIVTLLKNEFVTGAFVSIKDAFVRLNLMQSLASGLLNSKKVAIVKLSDLLKRVKSEFGLKNEDTVIYAISKCDVLIIDGLGNEAISAWSRDEVLFSLLDNRLQAQLTTILCSEYSLEDLKKVYKLNYNDEIKANQLIEKIRALG